MIIIVDINSRQLNLQCITNLILKKLKFTVKSKKYIVYLPLLLVSVIQIMALVLEIVMMKR